MPTIMELAKQIAAVSPITGVTSNGDIQFLPEATSAQRAQAQRLMDAWLALPPNERKSTPDNMTGIEIDKLIKRVEVLEGHIENLLKK